MDRCWLKGIDADALPTVLCMGGFNIQWLLWAISWLSLPGRLLVLFALALHGVAGMKNFVQPTFDQTPP